MGYANAGAAQRVLAAGAVVVLLTVWRAWAAAADHRDTGGAGNPPVWTPRELLFIYQGFNHHVLLRRVLRDKVRSISCSNWAPARDLKVIATGCSSPRGTGSVPPVSGSRMNVLQPACRQRTRPAGNAIGGRRTGKMLDLTPPARRGSSAAGECELIEQVKQSNFLPLFATRNVRVQARNCVPHQLCRIRGRLGCERRCWFPDPKSGKACPDRGGEVRASGLDGPPRSEGASLERKAPAARFLVLDDVRARRKQQVARWPHRPVGTRHSIAQPSANRPFVDVIWARNQSLKAPMSGGCDDEIAEIRQETAPWRQKHRPHAATVRDC